MGENLDDEQGGEQISALGPETKIVRQEEIKIIDWNLMLENFKKAQVIFTKILNDENFTAEFAELNQCKSRFCDPLLYLQERYQAQDLSWSEINEQMERVFTDLFPETIYLRYYPERAVKDSDTINDEELITRQVKGKLSIFPVGAFLKIGIDAVPAENIIQMNDNEAGIWNEQAAEAVADSDMAGLVEKEEVEEVLVEKEEGEEEKAEPSYTLRERLNFALTAQMLMRFRYDLVKIANELLHETDYQKLMGAPIRQDLAGAAESQIRMANDGFRVKNGDYIKVKFADGKERVVCSSHITRFEIILSQQALETACLRNVWELGHQIALFLDNAVSIETTEL